MASLRNAKPVIRNAQALELFMRVSPISPSFLDQFRFDKNSPARLLFSYELPESENPSAAIACEAHMLRLKPLLRIDPKRQPEADGIYYDINLMDPTLKDKILDLAAHLINKARESNPHYTLSYFPTKGNAPEGYHGLTDNERLYNTLSQGLPKKINRKYLEDLLPDMDHLAAAFREAKLPERYR